MTGRPAHVGTRAGSASTAEPRRCRSCSAPLVRRGDERASNFARRLYCDLGCVAAGGQPSPSRVEPARACRACGKPLTPHLDESTSNYRVRRTCNRSCGALAKQRPASARGVPAVEDTGSWRLEGVCAQPGSDPEWWFPEGQAGGRQAGEARARRLCLSCPVIHQCRSWALAAGMEFGVWGGLTEDDRDAIRKVAS